MLGLTPSLGHIVRQFVGKDVFEIFEIVSFLLPESKLKINS